MPFIKFFQDEQLFFNLLEYINNEDNCNRLLISSGYLNFPSKLIKILSISKNNLEFMTSSL